jgi:hypothetical protein
VHELVLDTIPAMTGLAGFLWTRNVLQANAIGLTTAVALHALRVLSAKDHHASAHPLVAGATLASVGVLGVALTMGSFGGALGIMAPSPFGWVLIASGVAAMALIFWLSRQHAYLGAEPQVMSVPRMATA